MRPVNPQDDATRRLEPQQVPPSHQPMPMAGRDFAQQQPPLPRVQSDNQHVFDPVAEMDSVEAARAENRRLEEEIEQTRADLATVEARNKSKTRWLAVAGAVAVVAVIVMLFVWTSSSSKNNRLEQQVRTGNAASAQTTRDLQSQVGSEKARADGLQSRLDNANRNLAGANKAKGDAERDKGTEKARADTEKARADKAVADKDRETKDLNKKIADQQKTIEALQRNAGNPAPTESAGN